MYAEERQARIMELLGKKGTVHSSEVAEELDVSRETVRRDILELHRRGLLIRTHGGAIPTGSGDILFETPYSLRETCNVEEKRRLCAFAASLLQESDTIFIDNSTTCANLLRYIPRGMHITIISNSARLFEDAAKYDAGNWTVISSGGQFSRKTMSMNGYMATEMLKQFSPTRAYFSCHGVDSRLLVLDHHLEDVEIKRTVLERAKRTYLLLDHSKINNSGVAEIAPISKFQHIIAGADIPWAVVREMRNQGIQVDLIGGNENDKQRT